VRRRWLEMMFEVGRGNDRGRRNSTIELLGYDTAETMETTASD